MAACDISRKSLPSIYIAQINRHSTLWAGSSCKEKGRRPYEFSSSDTITGNTENDPQVGPETARDGQTDSSPGAGYEDGGGGQMAEGQAAAARDHA